MPDDCIFCQIINKQIDSEIIFENNNLIVFKDIHPQAPVHLLIIPKKHIISLAELEEGDQALMGEIIYQAKLLAQKYKIADGGYKLIANTGPDGGQIVNHLHFHLLGGEKLSNFKV